MLEINHSAKYRRNKKIEWKIVAIITGIMVSIIFPVISMTPIILVFGIIAMIIMSGMPTMIYMMFIMMLIVSGLTNGNIRKGKHK